VGAIFIVAYTAQFCWQLKGSVHLGVWKNPILNNLKTNQPIILKKKAKTTANHTPEKPHLCIHCSVLQLIQESTYMLELLMTSLVYTLNM